MSAPMPMGKQLITQQTHCMLNRETGQICLLSCVLTVWNSNCVLRTFHHIHIGKIESPKQSCPDFGWDIVSFLCRSSYDSVRLRTMHGDLENLGIL